MRLNISLMAICFCLAGTVSAQPSGVWDGGLGFRSSRMDSAVHGQAFSEAPLTGALTVELAAPGSDRPLFSTALNGGSFEFDGVPAGQYRLEIAGSDGRPLYQETVTIFGAVQDLYIHVPGRSNSRSAMPGTVSRKQLEHKVPAAAQKAFNKGIAATAKGDQMAALQDFEKALAIDPDFADAHNNLGAVRADRGQLEKAAAEFQRAVELVPDHNMAVANLSIVLCDLGHYREAAEVARRALKLAPDNLKMRYVLGYSLIAGGGDPVEALANLERAAAEIPSAHLLAAKISAMSGGPNMP